MRVKEDNFSGGFEVDGKIPIKISSFSSNFISQSFFEYFRRKVSHISGSYGISCLELIEGVVGECKFLKIGYLYSD